MDIFFCDLCGVRVTDADLRAGHGIRSRLDVICGKCLELGHGKEWLAKRRARAAVGAGVATLDAARDRAQTVEEDVEADPVAGRPVAFDKVDTVSSEEDAPRSTKPGVPAIDVDATPSAPQRALRDSQKVAKTKEKAAAKAKSSTDSLSSAANMFSALGGTKSKASETEEIFDAGSADDEADDLPDVSDVVDLSPAAGNSVSPFADADADDKAGDADGKDKGDKSANSRTPRSGNRKIGTGVTTRPSTSARQRVAPSGKNPAGRSGSSKSAGRSSRRGNAGGNDKVMKFSMFSIMGIVLIFTIIMFVYNPGKKTGTARTDDPRELVRPKLEDAKSAVNSALTSTDPAVLHAALDKLNAADNAVMDLLDKAEKKKLGKWTEDDIAGFLQSMNWQDVRGQRITLNQALMKQKNY